MEGIRKDATLLKELKKLEARYPLPDLQKKLRREVRRIRARKVGGGG